MILTGYTDHWITKPGHRVRFHISSGDDYRVKIVRLRHGDMNPAGPGFRCDEIDTLPQEFRAHQQPIITGSYVRYEPDATFPTSLNVSLWVLPTLLQTNEQGLFARGDALQLGLDSEGCIFWRTGAVEIKSDVVELSRWIFVQASVDYSRGESRLSLRRQDFHPLRDAIERYCAPASRVPASGMLYVAALGESGPYRPFGCFTGKIGSVRVEISDSERAERDWPANDAPLAALAWHFGLDVGSRRATDKSGHERHGEIVNRPTRGVKGASWTGQHSRFCDAPDEYDAVHFHADDLEDCRWTESFAWEVPVDLDSGVYAAGLKSRSGDVRYVPFIVTPGADHPRAGIAVLLPTLSYLAYANESLDPEIAGALTPLRSPGGQKEDYAYIAANRINSLYDRHVDGSGRCMISTLRPNLTSFNPLHRSRLFNGPHQLGADLHLLDWLYHSGIPFDVITDHDLHREGAACLAPYAAVMTGTHAEYWTSAMLDALTAWKNDGGRFLYLSGNGLYWVTALDETGDIAEIRRFGGTESWTAPGGEATISLTGEQGGLWRDRGRPPQLLTGVGMAAQGFDRGAPFRRTAASREPRASFIFEGVDEDIIGDFPALVMNHGAAGYEIDRADQSLGTPTHALLLASSTGFSDSYQFVREESMITKPSNGGVQNPNVRADMVYYETANGGAVFSVGSISFCSTLSYNGYQNNISTILGNVLRTFANRDWQPGKPSAPMVPAPQALDTTMS